MTQRASLVDYAMHVARAGTSAALALSMGTAHDASNRIGFYADTTAAAEKVAMVIGGQTGPIYTRNGSVVDVVMNGALTAATVKASSLASGRITTAGAAGLLQDFAGLVIVGTPSATAPSTGTAGPGLLTGVVSQSADGASCIFTAVTFGNSTTVTTGFEAYACQGTAAIPAATASGDNALFSLRGHDGTNYTLNAASVQLLANSAWSPTNHESYIQFRSVANGSTAATVAGRIDPNQTLVWGGAVNGVGTFSAGTQRPHIQTAATTAANCNIAQSLWSNGAAGPTGVFAKSRSTTVGTQGVITTGDTLGTLSWQGDDGTNFIEAASLVAVAEGTIATGQVPGRLRVLTHNSAGTNTQAGFIDSSQVWGLTTSTAAPSGLYAGGTVTPKLQIAGSATGTISMALASHAGNAVGPTLYLGKSRSAAVFTGMTVVNASDALGTIDFQGADGTNFVSGAQIVVTATGTPGSTRMGTSMLFKTATDAAPSVMTTALTIDNAQMCTFAGDVTHADAKNLIFNTSTGSKIGTATGQKIGFWNATPVIQQAGANQVAPAAYVTGAFGLDSNAHMQALYDLVVAIRTALVNTGIIKGAA